MFNVIPQQDLYDPWGRPGAGAPLIHVPTGQKFTRYSGSLQDKLVFDLIFFFFPFSFVDSNNLSIIILLLESCRTAWLLWQATYRKY